MNLLHNTNLQMLDPREEERLAMLERTISEGVAQFVAVGLALAEIKAKRLYRAEFQTFDTYCRERWNMASRTAYQTIQSSQTCKLLEGLPMPENESVARVLSELPENERRDAWIEALKSDTRITADDLRLLMRRCRERTHNHQPIAPVENTTCPKCQHVFTPHFPERASRGDRRPSWAVEWAADKLGRGLSAIDYGCGRMRNVEAISARFNLLAVADTQVQLERVRHLTSLPCVCVDAGTLPSVDVCFCISVLHIIPDDAAALVCARMAAIAQRVVVEYPHGAKHYIGRTTTNFYREPTDALVAAWLPGWDIEHKRARAFSHARIYVRDCAQNARETGTRNLFQQGNVPGVDPCDGIL